MTKILNIRFITTLFRIGFISMLVLLYASYWLLSFNHFQSLLLEIQKMYQLNPDQIMKLEKILNQGTYDSIKSIILVLAICSTLFSLKLWRYLEVCSVKFLRFVAQAQGKVRLNYSSLRKKPNQESILVSVFLLVIAIYRWFVMLDMPIHEDEAFSFIHFVDKGFFAITSYYPGPNNHVFYNLLCWIVSWFSDDPFWIMKLPVYFIGLFVCLMGYILARKHFSLQAALILMVIIGFSGITTFYGVMGRGYSLQFFCMLSAVYGLVNILKEKDIEYYSFIFVTSSVIGFYTIPTFLYPFSAIAIFGVTFGLIIRGINIRPLLEAIFVSLLWVLVLYSPILLVNGLDAVTANSFVKPQFTFFDFIVNIPSYFGQVNNWFWGLPKYGILMSLLIFAVGARILFQRLNMSKWFWFYLLISLSIIPLSIMMIQRVTPYNRIWLFFLFFLYLFLSISIEGLVTSIIRNKALRLSVYGLVISTVIYLGITSINRTKTQDLSVYNDLNELANSLTELNATSLYSDDSTPLVLSKLKSRQLLYSDIPDAQALILKSTKTIDLTTYKLVKNSGAYSLFIKK